MPNRVLKESLRYSEKVNAMTDFQFRLWISLITYVDDYGRGDARTPVIKGACFPLRERIANKDIDAALAGLAGIGCVRLYEVDGKPYLYFPNWEAHQTIRNKRSKFPEPPCDSQTIESNCNQVNANVPVIQSESNPNTNTNPKEKTHAHGEYGWVKMTDAQYEKLCKDFGKEEAERGIAYVDEAAQQTGNKNKWSDWYLTVRKCIREKWGWPRSGLAQTPAPKKKEPEKPVSWKDGPTYLPDWAEDE